MADDVDKTAERSSVFEEANIASVRRKAAEMPKGFEGICGYCGEPSKRLVNGACARCRDKHNLP